MTEIGGGQLFDLDGLYSWIDTIPLSRPKKIISRDFADGVLVAEVIGHFIPKLVDLHNYPSTSSWSQKKVNWQTLNRRVFSKIGIRVSDTVISQLIDAKQGAIEQVLWDLRSKLTQGGLIREGRERRNTVYGTPQSVVAALNNKGNPFIVGPKLSRTDEPQLIYRVTSGDVNNNSDININSPGRTIKCPSRTEDMVNTTTLNGGFTSSVMIENGQQESLKSPSSTCQFGQCYIAPPTLQNSFIKNGKGPGPIVLSPVMDKHDNNNTDSVGPPAQIIYRGHKMIPLQFLDDKEKEIKALETSNRNLTLKIHRLEALVNVKDQRIEDLTHSLRNIKSLME